MYTRMIYNIILSILLHIEKILKMEPYVLSWIVVVALITGVCTLSGPEFEALVDGTLKQVRR